MGAGDHLQNRSVSSASTAEDPDHPAQPALHTYEVDYDSGKVRFTYRLMPDVMITDVHLLVDGPSGPLWLGAMKYEDQALRAWARAELLGAMIRGAAQQTDTVPDRRATTARGEGHPHLA